MMGKTLDTILSNHGAEEGELTESLKQSILRWVADEVIGANEYYPEHKSLLRVLDKSPQGLRDKLRNQQRKILAQHGYKGANQ